MAVRHARGEVAVGDRATARSIIGSRFDAELLGTTTVAGRPATLTRITGRGWIHGFHRIGLDPTDPWPQGYLLSDTWGDAFDLLS
jgi:proline racemase